MCQNMTAWDITYAETSLLGAEEPFSTYMVNH